MKRFLTLVGVAVVAAAMYVAAAPGSQQASGPTAKQFKALKKQVATLSKTLKAVKLEAADADGFVRQCLLTTNGGVVPVNQFGTPTSGFLFGTMNASTPRTALDVDTTTTNFTGAYLQVVDPACITSAGAAAHALRSGGSHLPLLAERSR
jgi:hypothetical protein